MGEVAFWRGGPQEEDLGLPEEPRALPRRKLKVRLTNPPVHYSVVADVLG